MRGSRRLAARTALATAAMIAVLATSATTSAIGPSSVFTFAQIEYPGNWSPRPNAISRMVWELMKRTSVEASLAVRPTQFSDPELYLYPFLYLAGDASFAPFSEEEIVALRRFLRRGGLLFVDSAEGRPDGEFDGSVRRLISRVFPDRELAPVDPNHVVYKSFYLIERQGGRILVRPYLEGIEVENRLAVLYSQNDLAGAWARDDFGNWEFDVTPGGPSQREMAFRMGINLVMYALCLDYKEDQVHIPFILKRRR